MPLKMGKLYKTEQSMADQSKDLLGNRNLNNSTSAVVSFCFTLVWGSIHFPFFFFVFL